MNRPYGVGIVGIQPGRSWAFLAHVPALQALSDDFRIVGIANTSLESARKAADALGVDQAFASIAEMVACPDVDIVVVTVKVPHHREIVRAALEAGKHVYCEWPLGNGLAEAIELADLARAKGLHGVVGTQARVSPAMRYLADLVADGYVGDVLSTTLVGTGMSWGPVIEQVNAYTADAANGANMMTIPLGHTMAAVTDVLGPVQSLGATIATRRKAIRIVDDNSEIPMTSPDQVLVAGTLESGAPISIHYRGGMPRGTGLLWEINGTGGDLQVRAMGGHTQFLDLAISGATGDEPSLQELAIPAKYLPDLGLDTYAQNVGLIYQRLAADLANGTHTAPSFDDAVTTHRFIAAIEQASSTGTTVQLADL